MNQLIHEPFKIGSLASVYILSVVNTYKYLIMPEHKHLHLTVGSGFFFFFFNFKTLGLGLKLFGDFKLYC